jgi:hypothetical protein
MITNEKHEFTYQLTTDTQIGLCKADINGPYFVNGKIDALRAGRAAVLRFAALVEELTPLSENWTVRVVLPDMPKNPAFLTRTSTYRGTVVISVDASDAASVERMLTVMQRAITIVDADLDRKVIEAVTRARTCVVHEDFGQTIARLVDRRIALLQEVRS